jgi:hypothetical protein
MHSSRPELTAASLETLKLCCNLYSFTWVTDDYASGVFMLSFLDVLKTLPLRSLTIRTKSDLGEEVWAKLNTLTGLHKVAIWCMDGPPRVLQGWAERLGSTLTELELEVSCFLRVFWLINVAVHV